MSDAKAFGGAKVIYVAQQIRKETIQVDMQSGDEIPIPRDPVKGPLFDYYRQLSKYQAVHAACLEAKVTCSVGLGISIPEGDTDTAQQRLKIVNQDGQSFREVIERVALDFETTGNGWLEVVRGKGGRVEELYHCPVQRVLRRPRGSATAYYYLPENGAKKPIPAFSKDERDPWALLHFMRYTGDSLYYGLPTWRGCAEDIELDYYATLYNRNFFINAGIPDMAIIVEGGEFDEETEQVVTTFFQNNFKGLQNSHRTLFLPVNENVKVRFEKLAVDQKNKDASFTSLRQQCRDNILSAHGVPPRLLSVVQSGSLGGSGEGHSQLKIFKELVIESRQAMFEEKLAPVLDSMGLPPVMFDKMDTDLMESNSVYYPAMTQAGIMTVKEAREDLGLPEETTDKIKASNTIYRYHLEAGVLTINEVRAGIGLPPITGGDERVVLHETEQHDEEGVIKRELALAHMLKSFRRSLQ